MKVREQLYQRNIFKTTRFEVPVISVGNLTLGGTGKTPLVQYIARLLQEHGMQPAIISRGYGGSTKERVNMVSDGKQVLLDAEFVGDEPRFLAETLPGVFVFTGVIRKLPAKAAVARGADVLLLDDGFQHMAIGRTLDLVLFQADTLAGNSRIFPGGDLREPVSALHRCSAFVITGVRSDNRERAERFRDLLQQRFPGKPLFFLEFIGKGFVQCNANTQSEQLCEGPGEHETGLAFCGIARPDAFRRSIEQLDLTLGEFCPLQDHHRYGAKERNFLIKKAKESKAQYFLTTEKDLVKLRAYDLPLPLYALRMEIPKNDDFNTFILERLISAQ